MNRNKAKMVFLVSAVVMELSAILLLIKAIATDSSPTIGIMILAIGMLFLIIGITRKSEGDKPETP